MADDSREQDSMFQVPGSGFLSLKLGNQQQATGWKMSKGEDKMK